MNIFRAQSGAGGKGCAGVSLWWYAEAPGAVSIIKKRSSTSMSSSNAGKPNFFGFSMTFLDCCGE
jgi:hypothetical protein